MGLAFGSFVATSCKLMVTDVDDVTVGANVAVTRLAVAGVTETLLVTAMLGAKVLSDNAAVPGVTD